jgi:glycosyltransferase involved in cell wall biosynthesis
MKISVIIPCYGRETKLQRALKSLIMQSHEDWECIVVDDCSPNELSPIVTKFGDGRIKCVRAKSNLGPYGARYIGYSMIQGHYLLQLDSDWELYPWALERALLHFAQTPSVQAVTGMHFRIADHCQFVGVANARYIQTPREFVREAPPPDCVSLVKREVVDHWLTKRPNYFAFEIHQWITFGLNFNQLFVDEPWTKYHTDGDDRVSTKRLLVHAQDVVNFAEEHSDLINRNEYPYIRPLIAKAWINLIRLRRMKEAEKLRGHFERNGINSMINECLKLLVHKIKRKLMRIYGAEKDFFVIGVSSGQK